MFDANNASVMWDPEESSSWVFEGTNCVVSFVSQESAASTSRTVEHADHRYPESGSEVKAPPCSFKH